MDRKKFVSENTLACVLKKLAKLLHNKVNKEAGKGLFSGDYEDLENKPTIPSVEGLASEEYVDEKIGDIDTILSSMADESEAI